MRNRNFLPIAALLGVCLGALPAAAKKRSAAPAHRSVAAAAPRVSKTKAATRTVARAKSSRAAAVPVRKASHSTWQQSPSSDRYREIQQALAGLGYYQGEPTGVWDSPSVDALRRFQREQNLKEDGKLGALSLIALGLGPKQVGETSAQLQLRSGQ